MTIHIQPTKIHRPRTHSRDRQNYKPDRFKQKSWFDLSVKPLRNKTHLPNKRGGKSFTSATTFGVMARQ
jgi:hypothetical protein